MAEVTEKCSVCRCLLLVPPNANTIRCAVCGKVSMPSKNSRWKSKETTTSVTPLSLSVHHSGWHVEKKAVLIGITYTGKRYELKGTVNDVKCMKYLLQKSGFSDHDIVVLTEEEGDPKCIPTRRNILAAMQWLVKDCRSGDSLMFHFSGHGSQQLDTNNDEMDGFDETLCPLDYETNGMIVDDDINDIMVRPLTDGVRFHAIIDACHSGTALDLSYLCKMNKKGYFEWEDHTPNSGIEKGTNGGLAISFSGCHDHQSSSDTSALSGYTTTGAMTYAFIEAVEKDPGATYGALLFRMRAAIKEANSSSISSLIKRVFRNGLYQEPQLCSSEKFDVYRNPFLL